MDIIESEAPILPDELSRLESKYDFRFPEQYRDFLLRNNGGRPARRGFHFMQSDGPYTDSLINWFLAVYDGKYDSFERTYTTLKVEQCRMPKRLVPIANDPFGNKICISVSGDDAGAIYFWDHEKEQDPVLGLPPTWDNVHLIAHSFDDFIKGLT